MIIFGFCLFFDFSSLSFIPARISEVLPFPQLFDQFRHGKLARICKMQLQAIVYPFAWVFGRAASAAKVRDCEKKIQSLTDKNRSQEDHQDKGCTQEEADQEGCGQEAQSCQAIWSQAQKCTQKEDWKGRKKEVRRTGDYNGKVQISVNCKTLILAK